MLHNEKLGTTYFAVSIKVRWCKFSFIWDESFDFIYLHLSVNDQFHAQIIVLASCMRSYSLCLLCSMFSSFAPLVSYQFLIPKKLIEIFQFINKGQLKYFSWPMLINWYFSCTINVNLNIFISIPHNLIFIGHATENIQKS